MKYPALYQTLKLCMDNGAPIPIDFIADLDDIGVMKTYEYFVTTLTRMVRHVYDGSLGGSFVGTLNSLLLGQISQAYERAWVDEGYPMPPADYIRDASQAMVLDQQQYTEGYYRDIVDARVDKTPLDPLLTRVELWANQYTSAYNDCVRLIQLNEGGKLEWIFGDTDHCETCQQLNGIVARASEWETAGVQPQSAPNTALSCGGYRCQCKLEPTDKRRSANALTRILDIVTSSNL